MDCISHRMAWPGRPLLQVNLQVFPEVQPVVIQPPGPGVPFSIQQGKSIQARCSLYLGGDLSPVLSGGGAARPEPAAGGAQVLQLGIRWAELSGIGIVGIVVIGHFNLHCGQAPAVILYLPLQQKCLRILHSFKRRRRRRRSDMLAFFNFLVFNNCLGALAFFFQK
jgi:hypothetical protein